MTALTHDEVDTVLKQQVERWLEAWKAMGVGFDKGGTVEENQVDATGLQDTIDAILADLKDAEERVALRRGQLVAARDRLRSVLGRTRTSREKARAVVAGRPRGRPRKVPVSFEVPVQTAVPGGLES
jgi:hypothetical protein